MNAATKVLTLIGLLLSTLAPLSGITLAAVGSLDTNEVVAENFKAHRFIPEYHYYVLLKGGIAYAVMGLDKGYRPQDDLSWKQYQPDSDHFKECVDLIATLPQSDSFTFGAYILDSEGNRIGTWFSSLTAGVLVNTEEKTVSITTDKPWIDNQ